ncbi:hypothetical protein IWW36_005248, partial [Coemansia brasiliensis]
STPLKFSQSSIAVSPRMDNAIGMDDLMMAANSAKLELFDQQQNHKAEAAVLMQAELI